MSALAIHCGPRPDVRDMDKRITRWIETAASTEATPITSLADALQKFDAWFQPIIKEKVKQLKKGIKESGNEPVGLMPFAQCVGGYKFNDVEKRQWINSCAPETPLGKWLAKRGGAAIGFQADIDYFNDNGERVEEMVLGVFFVFK